MSNTQTVTFNFRANADGIKRESLELELPAVTAGDILEALEDEDTRLPAYLVEVVNSEIVAAARKQIDTGVDVVNTEALTIQGLAYTPKASRGLGIDKEQWQAFFDDYVATAELAGKPKEGAVKTATLLKGKCTQVRTNVRILEVLADLLNTWYAETANASQHAKVYEYLSDRIQSLIEEAGTVNLEDFLV